MSHLFFEGTVYHKRYSPKKHEFTYPFYLLDIDLTQLSSLKNKLFSCNGLNLFSFKTKDHFGNSNDFMENVQDLLKDFGLNPTQKMHFITLPRVANFVFNPISLLIIFDEDKPTHLFAEVNNYNGGRIIYPVQLQSKDEKTFEGDAMKTMYVSPFLETKGNYKFFLRYEAEKLFIKIDLMEDDAKKLTASFHGKAKVFQTKSVMSLFAKHSFLTFWVVTRTLWQSFKLWRKGLTFYEPKANDKIRRH
ncbi:MAG: Unknown protein [uncultured Sulfurovum sp.]|uniref:DUF1365 domain-containing protein n=1 Tax=uncultured Sulfurovum sp. TaxID=269237 RepID=A0A6S6SIH4_9BACT|nr:MAG: Unknown protein [uncultured Sulfurovum sp.]